MAKLTDKQKRFVDEYLVDLNATQAAIRAGYKEKAAYRTGAENLRKPQIQEEIEKRQQQIQERTQITTDMLVKQLYKIAFHDITDYVTWNEEGGISVRPSDEVDGTILTEVSDDISDYGKYKRIKKKVKMPDRMKAIELLSRYTGGFDASVKVNGNIGVTIVDDVDDED